jgi:hypothetical protein
LKGWLGDVVVGPLLHGGNRRLRGGESGNHDHDGLRRDLLHHLEQIEAAAPGHLDVADHDVEIVGLDCDQGGVDVDSGDHVETLAAEEDLQELPHALLVVDDEDSRLLAHGVSP